MKYTIALTFLMFFGTVAAAQNDGNSAQQAKKPGADRAVSVQAMRLVGDATRTRLVVDLSREIKFGLLRLRDPYRLVVDLPNTQFDLEPETAPAAERGLVQDYRYGLVGPGRARIVLDLSGPVNVVQSFSLPRGDGQPARLVLDMAPGTAADFARASAQERRARVSLPGQKGDRLRRKRRNAVPVVVIDPGHGGIDTGATVSDKIIEKNLTLEFSRRLAEILTENGKMEAILTRTDDAFVSLSDRVRIARLNDAALFVSVHADIVPQSYVRGATVYTVSDEASDAVAARMAERENRSDILAGLSIEDQPDEVADILFDLARRETKNLSIRFARTLIGGIRPELTLNKSPWRRASFLVLKAPDVPSVLFELGYLSNNEDRELLSSQAWQEKTAQAVARAIEQFLVPGRTVNGG